MSLIGYARVSTAEGRQVLDRQLDALNAAGCERMFKAHASGATARSPEPRRLPRLPAPRWGPRRPRLRPARPPRGELITLIDELSERGILLESNPRNLHSARPAT